jgi:tRNA pseudouridine55 synthase
MTRLRSNQRAIHGILLLDKPIGMTSNAALQIVKKLYNAKKAGHTGSLDPLASGMLPICFGEATKFSQYLLEADKFYRVNAKLGIKTATGDREGEILDQRPVPPLTSEQLSALFAKFTGSIEQIPSMYSALKHNGQPLYKLARQGIEVAREPRQVNIHAMHLLEQGEDYFCFDVHCSKGTYIRTLVEDMGETLGCGAHVAELRRLSAGPYQPDEMKTLPHLEELQQTAAIEQLDSYLLPVDSSLNGWPLLPLSEAAIYYLKQGQPIIVPHAPTQGWVRLSHKNGSFIGVGEILKDGRVAPRRLVQHA